MTVHPRMRGERYPALEAVSRAPGSSPHARGTRTDKVVVDDIRRFIPACAGNASRASQYVSGEQVHPRMRGERTSNKLLIYRRKSEPSDSTKHSGC